MRMIDEDDVGLKEKPDTSKTLHQIRPESQRERAQDLIPNFAITGDSGLGKVQVRHA